MTSRLPAILGGAALVAIGLVLLLRNLGVLPARVSVWPLVLLAVGVVLVVTGLRQRADEPAPEVAALPVDGARSARLVLKHGAGTLDVGDPARPGVLFEGTFAGGVRQELRRDGDRIEVTLRHPADLDRLARQSRGLWWTLGLAPDVPLDLEVQTGASRARLDLTAVALRSLRMQAGASDVDVKLPASCRAHVSAGAADVRLHVPAGVAASITTKSALASVQIDETRFPRSGRDYRSPGYESDDQRVDIVLEGGVASFRVD